jgi:hypothetical protein
MFCCFANNSTTAPATEPAADPSQHFWYRTHKTTAVTDVSEADISFTTYPLHQAADQVPATDERGPATRRVIARDTARVISNKRLYFNVLYVQ